MFTATNQLEIFKTVLFPYKTIIVEGATNNYFDFNHLKYLK